MSDETPGGDPVPGWGQPKPEPDADEATAPWPEGATPPETPWAAAAEPPVAEPPVAEPVPAAPWGAPDPASQQPSWESQPQQPPGGWGAPPQQPPGGWGAPPQQAQGWGPTGPGAPGGPPVGWAPAPASSGGSGCVKGCLIVAAIGVVLIIVGVIALMVFVQRFAEDMGINPDGTVAECALISSGELSNALDGSAEALPLGGIVDATVGRLLDKRVLPDAEDCWIATESSATGRIARQVGGDASGAYRTALDAARTGGYYAGDVSEGDEAFCTAVSEAGSFGVLVRRGDTLVYVSLIDPAIDSSGFGANEDGELTSAATCTLAARVASRVR